MTRRPTTAEVEHARRAMPDGGVLRTPLVRVATSSDTEDVRVKLEGHQRTGSFKVRGATAAVAAARVRNDGAMIATASAGNHGLGLAEALRRFGMPGRIFVPNGANPRKVEALERYQPEVSIELVSGSYDDTERAAQSWAKEAGATFVSSYNDPNVIAGQATVGLEILEAFPEVEAIVAPVGGGGLLSGICAAIDQSGRPVRALGVEPTASAAMTEALKHGRIVPISDGTTSMAEGLVGNLDHDAVTFEILRDHQVPIETVSEAAIGAATIDLYERYGFFVEPSAAAAWCGLNAARAAGLNRIAVVLTGSNVDPDSHARLAACAAGRAT